MTQPVFYVLLDYIRMVSYAVVILTTLRGIRQRAYSYILLLLGEFLMATMLLLTLATSTIFGGKLDYNADLFLTPASLLWAILHYIAMIRSC